MVLVKEYRIPLPLTVEEYRIAQLYMIQKKSRLESTGTGSRVEILKNVPYTDGPGGSGQYTKKIYHIGSHIPGWIKAFLPKTALRVEEEAWNAYPYTKTRTTCPFMDKFYLDVETYYNADPGLLENVFNLSPADRSTVSVDLIDPVKDPYPSNYYKAEEDPKTFVCKATKRGPLAEDWLDEYVKDPKKQPIMCAYKLIKVEFKYWGIQSKVEQFIQESARKTVLVAHRQAWSWQDEWCSLTIDDIRKLEAEVQKDLLENNPDETESRKGELQEGDDRKLVRRSLKADLSMKLIDSPKQLKNEQSTEEIILGIRMTSIEEDSEEGYLTPESDDEYVDAVEDFEDETKRLNTIAPVEGNEICREQTVTCDKQSYSQVESAYEKRQGFTVPRKMTDTSMDSTPKSVLLLVFHGGGVADLESDPYPKVRDFKTFRSVFTSVASLLYPSAEHGVALRLVECPPLCPQIVENLKKISVFTEEKAPSAEHGWLPPTFPVSCIPLLLVSSLEFYQGVDFIINEANSIYKKFLETTNTDKENIKVSILADCVGALLVYGALCSQRNQTGDINYDSLFPASTPENMSDKVNFEGKQDKLSTCQRSESTDSTPLSHLLSLRGLKQFDFDVTNFFCCGSPIGMILMKQYFESNGSLPVKPVCDQVFNLFLPFDPVASRLEPLIDGGLSTFEPAHIPRYQTFPFRTEILYETCSPDHNTQKDVISRRSPDTPTETMSLPATSNGRKISTADSCCSVDTIPEHQAIFLNSGNWWGTKRVDYMLYCPDGLQQFPFSALTQLCYSSYWESRDMVAFILWQILDEGFTCNSEAISFDVAAFQPVNPREKWLKKRTMLKIKNMHSNHRANDVIVSDGAMLSVSGKFVYGPIEVAALTAEKVDVYISLHRQMENWKLLGTALTDSHGRLEFTIPESESAPHGIHAVKMVVRGDHSSVDCNVAVVPRAAEAVVFSIDGSFLAAYSLRAIDPKIRGGAVDVVRHWQELGYLIIYVTSRLLFQKHQVTRWLAQHNFPLGIVSFCESIRKDYQKHKQEFLRGLVNKETVSIHAAYGSSRDIQIYSSLGLSKEQIFIVGKQRSHKNSNNFQVISEGYATHLVGLPSHQLSRHAVGPLCSLLPWTCFGIPAGTSKSNRQQKNTGLRFNPFHKSKSQQPEDEADGDSKPEAQVAVRVRSTSRPALRR